MSWKDKDGNHTLVDLQDAGKFIFCNEDATSYDMTKLTMTFIRSTIGLWTFQRILADYPADTVHETIVDFHE